MGIDEWTFDSFSGSGAGTVVAVVGERADEALTAIERMPGVEALAIGDLDPAVGVGRVRASAAPWVVHDADPLAHVAASWIELFDERATLGALEAEVDDALDRFATGRAIMPDYYIVIDPDRTATRWRHWWCGALGRHAPRRIVPASATSGAGSAAGGDPGQALRRALRSLPASRPWPDPDAWLPDLPFAIPDRIGLRD